MMLDVNAMRNKLRTDLEAFEREVAKVYDTLVIPNWAGELHGFPHTLYGYMMRCFAYIDLLSAYWQGNEEKQTLRMINLMQEYMSPDREACSVAVQMWRHKLMHTAEPRYLLDENTGKKYRWLLHWYEHLPESQHWTFADTSDSRILNMGLVYLVRDLRRALEAYLADLAGRAYLQTNLAKKVEKKLQSYKLKAY